MLLTCQNIQKSFGEKVILDQVSFHIEEREKVALIGSNGAGKTTLLRIIRKEMEADEGQITLAKGAALGYLAQSQDVRSGRTIYQELLTEKQYLLDMEEKMRQMELAMKRAEGEELEKLMNAYASLTQQFERDNGYACKSEVTGVLKGLGFSEEEFHKPIANLSGGQKTRVALGCLLLGKPDILLLDEPTNHLDMDSIVWLETYLLNYPGAALLVSHDRYFLDRIVTRVIELEQGKAMDFSGNYTAFSQKKAQVREAQLRAYENQQQEIRHQEEVIAKLKSFNREKSIRRAESREKKLDKITLLEKPSMEESAMHMRLTPRMESGKDVLAVQELSKSFGSNCLFDNLSFEIKRGERVALIGGNGMGKTTILKMIIGQQSIDRGTCSLGSRVRIGYYDQEHQALHMEKTIFDELSDAYPTLNHTEIRNALAAFLFTGDDVFKKISALSGGERGRVALAKLMLSEANFLLLDEPTNHLDILSREILEEALNNYTGTLLYVSHDRYFINRTATRILDLTNRALVNYAGGYDYYLEKKDELTEIYAPAQETDLSPSAVSQEKLSWKQKKEEQARKRKRENDLKKTEKRIGELEERDSEINQLLSQSEIATDPQKCAELSSEQADIQAELEDLYEQWESLAEDSENI